LRQVKETNGKMGSFTLEVCGGGTTHWNL